MTRQLTILSLLLLLLAGLVTVATGLGYLHIPVGQVLEIGWAT